MEVVVEGVETAQQRDVLIDLGCRRAQGFLFARPSTGATIEQLLAADQPLGIPPLVTTDHKGDTPAAPAGRASTGKDRRAAPGKLPLGERRGHPSS